MKAVIYEKYGPPEVLKLTEVDKPIPEDNEVLVKVHATTVTVGDSRMRSFTVPAWQWVFARLYLGILKPRRSILGMELAGDIEAVGKTVTRFSVDDPVFASTFNEDFGGYAEYKCFAEDSVIATKPENLSYEEAAAIIGGGMTALGCLEKADIQAGQEVLIYGASGAVGTNAVQLAKYHYGAQVTGVCSTSNLDLVTSLGADEVVDYTQEDFTQRGNSYDVVFDAVAKFSPAQAKTALKPTGTYLNVHRDSDGDSSNPRQLKALLAIKSLAEAGKLKPTIDRCYPLEDIVEAHRYVDKGHKKGNVVINVI